VKKSIIGLSDSTANCCVGMMPITIITDPQGNVLRWKKGGMDKAEFLEWLEKVNPSAARRPL